MPVYLNLSDLESPLMIQLAANIRARCKKLRITQSELAERSGVAASHISFIARAKANPTVSTLERIADALGMPVVQLLASKDSAKGAGSIKTTSHSNRE